MRLYDPAELVGDGVRYRVDPVVEEGDPSTSILSAGVSVSGSPQGTWSTTRSTETGWSLRAPRRGTNVTLRP